MSMLHKNESKFFSYRHYYCLFLIEKLKSLKNFGLKTFCTKNFSVTESYTITSCQGYINQLNLTTT